MTIQQNPPCFSFKKYTICPDSSLRSLIQHFNDENVGYLPTFKSPEFELARYVQ